MYAEVEKLEGQKCLTKKRTRIQEGKKVLSAGNPYKTPGHDHMVVNM